MAAQTTQPETRPGRLSPTLAGVTSLLVPGLGQILLGLVGRGFLLMGTWASIIALLFWRVQEMASTRVGQLARLGRAFERQPLFMLLMLVGFAVLWLWIAWDAYQQAKPEREGRLGVFIYALLLFFILGWQISEINPGKAITELPDAWPPLSRILWPWEAAFERETTTISAGAEILSPCDELPPPPPSEEVPGQPYLVADPTCGDLSTRDVQNREVPGTVLTLIGRGFAPNTETEIWWVDPLGNAFRMRKGGEYVGLQTDDQGGFDFQISMPYRLIPPSAAGRQIHRIEARQISGTGGLKPSEALRLTIMLMIETIFLGMMATVYGILFAVPTSFLAAKNMMSGSRLTIAIYYLTRTILNIVRAIEPLIWALIAVVWVGLGPFAGIIALTVHSVAALGKLYSEAIESIDSGPIEAIQATGATGLQVIIFGVVPQIVPPFISFSIYRWDINVRMSTVIGLVGGGGIGFLLVQYIRLLDYRSAGIAVWFIAITVAVLDYVSAEIRQRTI
jgi:phosphonate transport system permease protein